MAANASQRQPRQRRIAAAFDALPPDCLQRVAELGFTSQVNPFWDRHDLLREAANLACVGNEGCTQLAHLLFKHLSPHLGMELPLGVTERSTAKQLKEALKAWGLPVGGSKGALWERLMDEVQDTEEDEEGDPPQHCLVSGATRKELQGYSGKRISQGKAKDVFGLTKSDLQNLDYIDDFRRGGFGAKLYLVQEVKRRAREMHPKGYKVWREQEAAWKVRFQQIREDEEQKRKARDVALRAELAQRGHSAAEVAAILADSNPGVGCVTWGSLSSIPAAEAADHLERMHFCISSTEREEAFAVRFAYDPVVAPKHLSQYKAKEQRLERSAQSVLRWYVSNRRTLKEIRDDPQVPASLLPELEGLWQAAKGKAAASIFGAAAGFAGAGPSTGADGAGPSSAGPSSAGPSTAGPTSGGPPRAARDWATILAQIDAQDEAFERALMLEVGGGYGCEQFDEDFCCDECGCCGC